MERLGDELLERERSSEPPRPLELVGVHRRPQALDALVVERLQEREDGQARRLSLELGGAELTSFHVPR